jgi:hypothetical protein
MKKITEQQLIQSARRLKTIVLETKDDTPAEPYGGPSGVGAGALLGKGASDVAYNRLAGRPGSVDAAGKVVTKEIAGWFPEFMAKFGTKGKAVAGTIMAIATAFAGYKSGKTAGQFIDDYRGIRKTWNDKLGISGVTFTPDWRSMGINYFKDKTVTCDPNTGMWIINGTGDDRLGVDERVRQLNDTSTYLALVQQALVAIIQGKATIDNVTVMKPAGDWNIMSNDHLAVLSKYKPKLRDKLIFVYNEAHPDDLFPTASLDPAYVSPVAQQTNQQNGQQNNQQNGQQNNQQNGQQNNQQNGQQPSDNIIWR